MHFFERLNDELEQRKKQGNYRELPLVSWRGNNIVFDSMDFTDLASNDYLCIARDTAILNSFFQTVLDNSSGYDFVHEVLISSISLGSTGSRLLTGSHTTYAYCEELLASLFNGCAQCEITNQCCGYQFPEEYDSLVDVDEGFAHLYGGLYDCNAIFREKNELNMQIRNDTNSRYIENIEKNFVLSNKKHKYKNKGKNKEKGKFKKLKKNKSFINCFTHPIEDSSETNKENLLTSLDKLNQACSLKAMSGISEQSLTEIPVKDQHSKDTEFGDSSLDSSKNKASLAELSAIKALNQINSSKAIDQLNSIQKQDLESKPCQKGEGCACSQSQGSCSHDKYADEVNKVEQCSQKQLQSDYEERDCLYINSGFDANAGIIATLFAEKDLLLVDKLCHASIIDGMMKSKAKALRFAHNDIHHLTTLIDKYHKDFDSIVVITESVFSMDGDRSKLQEIVALKECYSNLLIYVDEAHSFGLLGESGLGLCQELKVIHKVDFIMGTLSKAIGSQGAFLICKKEVKAYLVNFMRAFIFSTALPPVNVTFSMYIIGLLKTAALQYKREYLCRLSEYFHLNLRELDLEPSESQIQPLLTKDNDRAMQASQIFREAGLLAMPIRHPTVPLNKARLRLSLNCNLTIDDIDLICKLIKRNRKLFF